MGINYGADQEVWGGRMWEVKREKDALIRKLVVE